MKDKINVEEILNKHELGLMFLKYDRLKSAIKEIVESVIDKCAEEASLNGREYNSNTKETKDITEEIGGDCYWHGHPEDQPYPDLTIAINKESILQIKNIVSYE